MDIMVSGQNMKVTDALEDYAKTKLSRLDRYLPNIVDVRLDFVRENSRRGEDLARAQITVRHSRGAILRAEESVQGDFQAALNLAIDKMHRRIERFKGKRSRKGRERFSATIEELNIAEALPETLDVQDAPELIEEEPQIIRHKQVAVSTMTEEEAAEQMELLGHTFFLFFNGSTGSINVIYKRGAGGYGVLIPQVE